MSVILKLGEIVYEVVGSGVVGAIVKVVENPKRGCEAKVYTNVGSKSVTWQLLKQLMRC